MPYRSLLILAILLVPVSAGAQTVPSKEVQILGAISPAPDDLKDDARILGYEETGEMIELRAGSNDFTCLADNPTDDRFHAACYHNSLEPFMTRGRELRAEGKGRDEIREIRLAEIKRGDLNMPDQPAALYQLFGESGAFDAATGALEGANPLYVMYMPYATTESTGLSSQAPMPGAPWLMDAGLPWAHIMYSPPQPNNQ